MSRPQVEVVTDYSDTQDFGDYSHAEHTDGTRCIYCDATREEAKIAACPVYDEEERVYVQKRH